MGDEELNKKFQIFEREIIQIQEQIKYIEDAIFELENIFNGLSELIGKNEEEILSPIGRGIFVKTKLISQEILVDVGEKNFVKKTISETKELIKNQIQKLNEMKFTLEENLNQIDKEITKVMKEHEEENKHPHKDNCKECDDENCECNH